MVPVAAPRVTKIGFRRDIRLFFGMLVGFLVLIILVLLLLLQSTVSDARQATFDRWELAADVARDHLDHGDVFNRQQVTADLVAMRGKYDIVGVEVRPFDGGAPIRTGVLASRSLHTETRSIPQARVVFAFDSAFIDRAERGFQLTAGVSIAATIFGTILLLLYLPTITRPIEQMLDHARELGERESDADETAYLIETFRTSIDRLKQQEDELKHLHQLEKTRADDLQRITATLTRSLSSGFIALDGEGRIVDMNSAARDILRIPREGAVTSEPPRSAFGDTAFSRCLEDAWSKRESLTRREIGQTTTGGEERVVGLTTVPLSGENAEYLGMLALFTDLTPIRDLETRVREMQTLADLGEMSAGIAHEFRNSLATILGYLKLAGRPGATEDTERRLRNAEKEAIELASAVDGLLSFARPMKLEPQPTQLKALLEEIVGRVSEGHEGIDITVDGPELEIEADPRLLSRAFENIVRNAVESVKEKGSGRVQVATSDGATPAVVVQDTGVGLDTADATRLFLPFHTSKMSGMGLGLPLAKKIILLHGGTIRLEGRRGAGATATIEFPPHAA